MDEINSGFLIPDHFYTWIFIVCQYLSNVLEFWRTNKKISRWIIGTELISHMSRCLQSGQFDCHCHLAKSYKLMSVSVNILIDKYQRISIGMHNKI